MLLQNGLFFPICPHADSSMTEFTQYQDQTSLYYSDLMTKLARMNSTLGFVLHYLDNMQNRLEQRLHVIQRYLGWAGEQLMKKFAGRSFAEIILANRKG